MHLLAGAGRQRDRGRRRRPGDLPLPLRRAAQHPAPSASATPRHRQIVLGAQLPLARRDPRTPPSRCVAPQPRSATAKALIAVRGAGGRVERARRSATTATRPRWVAGLIADALAAGTPPAEVLVLARTGYATRPDPGRAGRGRDPAPRARLASASTSAPRSATRSPTSRCWPTRPTRRRSGAPCRRRGAASARPRIEPRRRRRARALRRRPDRRQRPRPRAHRRSARSRRATGSPRFGAGSSASAAEYRAGRSLGHVVVATVTLDGGLVAHHEQRRDRSPQPDERRDAERVLEDLRSLCRAAQAFDDDQVGTGASLTGFLEHAAGLHAAGAPARRGPPHHRLHHPPRQGHRSRSSCCCSAARSSCCRPGARCESADPEDLDEERRLFYVAATRAKDRLVITRCRVRGGRPTGGPSRFLAEAGLDLAPARARRLTHPSTRRSHP